MSSDRTIYILIGIALCLSLVLFDAISARRERQWREGNLLRR